MRRCIESPGLFQRVVAFFSVCLNSEQKKAAFVNADYFKVAMKIRAFGMELKV